MHASLRVEIGNISDDLQFDTTARPIILGQNADLRSKLDRLHVDGEIVLYLNVELPAGGEKRLGPVCGNQRGLAIHLRPSLGLREVEARQKSLRKYLKCALCGLAGASGDRDGGF